MNNLNGYFNERETIDIMKGWTIGLRQTIPGQSSTNRAQWLTLLLLLSCLLGTMVSTDYQAGCLYGVYRVNHLINQYKHLWRLCPMATAEPCPVWQQKQEPLFSENSPMDGFRAKVKHCSGPVILAVQEGKHEVSIQRRFCDTLNRWRLLFLTILVPDCWLWPLND